MCSARCSYTISIMSKSSVCYEVSIVSLGALYWFAIWSAISFRTVFCQSQSGSSVGSESRYTTDLSRFEPGFDQKNCWTCRSKRGSDTREYWYIGPRSGYLSLQGKIRIADNELPVGTRRRMPTGGAWQLSHPRAKSPATLKDDGAPEEITRFCFNLGCFLVFHAGSVSGAPHKSGSALPITIEYPTAPSRRIAHAIANAAKKEFVSRKTSPVT